jgi:very-short-patch-repair endonuclease
MLHAPTPSEEALWQALRGGVLGVAFKRQVVIGGRYIVDFFAPSVGLVVEVDGGVHRSSRAADCRRDEKLRRLGYRVVRVPAALVMRDVDAALAVVRAALK